jgi:multiple sugar transport system permease protein
MSSATATKPVAAGRGMRKGPGRQVRRSGPRRGEAAWGYVMIAPIAVGLTIFYLYPIGRTLYLSFTEWGAFGGQEWIGLGNYQGLADDSEVLDALVNTFFYSFIVLLGIPLSIVVATLLNARGLRGVSLYRTIYFIPVVTMPVAVAIVWKWIYNGDFGVLNYLLSLVGVNGTSWLTNPGTALFAVSVVGIWTTLGYNVVILLAGLQDIPGHYYEAAALDGAGPVRQFFSVTLPLLSPSIFFVTVLTLIQALQVFDLIFVMIEPTNPALPATRSVVYLFYQEAFVKNNGGYAAAIVMALLLIILLMTTAQFRLQRRWVHYG